MKSEIIIMLTWHDKTVENAREAFEQCKDLPVKYWGFKDVGLPPEQMKELVSAIKAAGKTAFLEVVSYTEDACMRGAKIAAEYGFDILMGTVYYPKVFDYIKSQGLRFMPFCGKVSGSPSVLEGSFEEIVADANFLLEQGVFGIDLLSYRHTVDGEGLARYYCEKIKKPVVIAGSINSFERIKLMSDLSPWGFTMGSALFDQCFSKEGDVRENLIRVLEYMKTLP